MKNRPEISNIEWTLVIGFAVMVDVFQFILNIFAIGIVANRFIDVGMGATIATYFLLRGQKITKTKAFSFIGTMLGEMAPLLDSFPLWSLYLFATMLIDKAERKAEKLLAKKNEASAPQQNNVRNFNEYRPSNTSDQRGDTEEYKKAA